MTWHSILVKVSGDLEASETWSEWALFARESRVEESLRAVLQERRRSCCKVKFKLTLAEFRRSDPLLAQWSELLQVDSTIDFDPPTFHFRVNVPTESRL